MAAINVNWYKPVTFPDEAPRLLEFGPRHRLVNAKATSKAVIMASETAV